MTFDIITLQLQFSIAVVLVLILRQFMKKLPKIYSYLLWILVFARLLCPFSLELEHGVMPQANIVRTENYIDKTSSTKYTINGNVIAVTQERIIDTPEGDFVIENTSGISNNTIQTILKAIWILGTAFILVYNSSSLLILREKLKDATLLKENIYLTEQISTPFTIGIIKTKIYLPAFLASEERTYIICHEKVHAKRKDNLIKNIAFLLTAVYWFNPLSWTAFHFMEQDMEMACDEEVLREMGTDIKKLYSQSLLDFAAGQQNRAFTPLTFGEVSVKQRVKNVLIKQNTKKRLGILGVVIILAAAVLVFTTKKEPTHEANIKEPASESTIPVSVTATEDANKFVRSWANAFITGDVDYIMAHTSKRAQEEYRAHLILLKEEDGTATFGWSSPWPWGDVPYEFAEITNKQATIYYYALISTPSVIVWTETICYEQQENGEYLITEAEFTEYNTICSSEEYIKAYPEGVINGTPVDYLTNGLGEALNSNAKQQADDQQYYLDLFTPETAAAHLLNLLLNENKVLVTVDGERSKDGECIVKIQFMEDGTHLYVKMIQPYGEDGIWIPQTED